MTNILSDLRDNQKITHDYILRDLRGNQKINMTFYILRDLRGNQKIKHDTLYP